LMLLMLLMMTTTTTVDDGNENVDICGKLIDVIQ